MHRLALVVPTKDRPDDLRRMLASLTAQTLLPHQVLIVDGSERPVSAVVDDFPQLPLEYVRCVPPSLARQRNAGMARLADGITLAGYVDDDVVLERDAIEAMMLFWAAAGPDVGGAAFNIANNPVPGQMALKQVFLIDHRRPGRVLPSGCQTSLHSHEQDSEVQWLNGGATIWRRTVIAQYAYDEWFVGTGFMEDVDFSFAVRGKYRLFVVSGARVAHYSRPVRPERQYLLGKWQVVNRMYIVRKYRARGLSPAAAWYATAGLLLLNLGAALLRGSKAHWNRARGNLAGIWSELSGRREQIGGHLK